MDEDHASKVAGPGYRPKLPRANDLLVLGSPAEPASASFGLLWRVGRCCSEVLGGEGYHHNSCLHLFEANPSIETVLVVTLRGGSLTEPFT